MEYTLPMTLTPADLHFARNLAPELRALGDNELIDLIENDLVPYLTVAIRTQAPNPKGNFYPAATGRASSFGKTSDPEELHYADEVVRQRRAMEKRRGLVQGTTRPVSAFLCLHGLPGRGDGLVSWLADGMDDTQVYGDTITLLKPDVLARSVLLAGDSFNLDTGDCYARAVLTPARAALLLAVSAADQQSPVIPGMSHDVEYLEALIVGGLHFGTDAVTVTMPPVAAQEAMAGRPVLPHGADGSQAGAAGGVRQV